MSRRGAQLLTTVLAGVCAVFLVLALMFQFGVGAGYSWLTADPDEQSGLSASGIDSTAFKLPPETEFDVVHERPLFNEDRKPAPDQPTEVAADVPPPPALNINLTGTIRSPGVSLVMVQDKSKNQSVALKEGMPLPGDLSAWTLEKVKARSAIFKSTAGEEIEVELTVAAGSPKTGGTKPGSAASTAPAFGPGPGPSTAPAPTTASKGPPSTSNQSEDLQKRIEERRKQMREAAERNRKQGQPPPPANPNP